MGSSHNGISVQSSVTDSSMNPDLSNDSGIAIGKLIQTTHNQTSSHQYTQQHNYQQNNTYKQTQPQAYSQFAHQQQSSNWQSSTNTSLSAQQMLALRLLQQQRDHENSRHLFKASNGSTASDTQHSYSAFPQHLLPSSQSHLNGYNSSNLRSNLSLSMSSPQQLTTSTHIQPPSMNQSSVTSLSGNESQQQPVIAASSYSSSHIARACSSASTPGLTNNGSALAAQMLDGSRQNPGTPVYQSYNYNQSQSQQDQYLQRRQMQAQQQNQPYTQVQKWYNRIASQLSDKHRAVLRYALQKQPELFPSFMKCKLSLLPKYLDRILATTATSQANKNINAFTRQHQPAAKHTAGTSVTKANEQVSVAGMHVPAVPRGFSHATPTTLTSGSALHSSPGATTLPVERQLVQLRKQIAIISEKKTNLQHQLKEAEKTRSNNFQTIESEITKLDTFFKVLTSQYTQLHGSSSRQLVQQSPNSSMNNVENLVSVPQQHMPAANMSSVNSTPTKQTITVDGIIRSPHAQQRQDSHTSRIQSRNNAMDIFKPDVKKRLYQALAESRNLQERLTAAMTRPSLSYEQDIPTDPITRDSEEISRRKRAKRFDHSILGSMKTQEKPFINVKDAFERLLAYHAFSQEVLAEKDGKQAEEIFGLAVNILNERVVNIHRQFQEATLRNASKSISEIALTVGNERLLTTACHEEEQNARSKLETLRQARIDQEQEERTATALLAAELFASSRGRTRYRFGHVIYLTAYLIEDWLLKFGLLSINSQYRKLTAGTKLIFSFNFDITSRGYYYPPFHHVLSTRIHVLRSQRLNDGYLITGFSSLCIVHL
eukprot:gene9092-1396_t